MLTPFTCAALAGIEIQAQSAEPALEATEQCRARVLAGLLANRAFHTLVRTVSFPTAQSIQAEIRAGTHKKRQAKRALAQQEALRSAMLDTRKKYPDPFNWAAFIRRARLNPVKALTLAVLLASVLPLAAQGAITVPLPRPLRLIVPYVPGGGTDTVARLIAPALGEAIGQQVVVDNRPGGSSSIATQLVARAAPDGQTIGISDAAFVTNPSLFEKLPYDTLRDFVPIAIVSSGSMLLVVHPSLPAKTIKDLVALAKAQPGKLTYGTAGNGTATHLAGEQLRWVAQIDILHIPYKGAGQSITELMGAHLSMAFTSPSTAKAHVASGRLRALAITSAKRNAAMPEVVTFIEAGFAKVDTQTLTTLFAPAGVSASYVTAVNAAVMGATRTGELRERFQSLGYDPESNTPAEAAARVRTEIEKWRMIIKSSGARAHGT